MTRTPWLMLAGFSVLEGALVTVFGYGHPRVTRRRREALERVDPGAAQLHRRQRIGSIVGLVGGGLLGLAVVLATMADLR